MSDVGDESLETYGLLFLTDQWEWDGAVTADTLETAKDASRAALETVVRDERPQLACVTVLKDGLKIGIWDWVANQAYWTRL